MTLTLPSPLVEPGWLAQHLGHPDLRILDCTAYWHSDPQGARYESGRPDWEGGHIPGSSFADLIVELSDRNTTLPFMLPSAERFAAAMARQGVGEGTVVVLYDCRFNMWAARLWWMLRAFGFDNAAVLNGGWQRWQVEGRPVSIEPAGHPPAHFVARPRPELFAGVEQVLVALDDRQTSLVNALDHESFAKQRIPKSVLVPWTDLVDPHTHAFHPPEALRKAFQEAGVWESERTITYCRAGILACSAAFLLTTLGKPAVTVYDGSLFQWLADPALPVETG